MNNQDFFKEHGYCIVRSAVSTELLDFVTQYTLFDEMQDYRGDDQQSLGAHSKYGDPAMETMLLHLHSVITKNTGLELYPTYSYYRVYRNGNDLKPHKDRESCEISATMCFNYSYDDNKYTWPIFMDGNAVGLKPGDLVIYRGCDLKHWRESFDCYEDAWHVQGFFHYVDKAGPFVEHKFDKRSTVGELRKPVSNEHVKSYIKFLK